MIPRYKRAGLTGGAIALTVMVVTACQNEPKVVPTEAHSTHDPTVAASIEADIEDVLAVVRRLTQPYRRFSAARAAGYDAQLTPCMESPPAGGMGYHYGAPALIDGKVEARRPEILMYEPQRNGDLLLVGVEYVVPYVAWTSPNPPSLAGVPFHRNDAFGLWVLHAWVWKHNPSGVLSDWNPNVSCQNATTQ